jgi:hypothetical protein
MSAQIAHLATKLRIMLHIRDCSEGPNLLWLRIVILNLGSAVRKPNANAEAGSQTVARVT